MKKSLIVGLSLFALNAGAADCVKTSRGSEVCKNSVVLVKGFLGWKSIIVTDIQGGQVISSGEVGNDIIHFPRTETYSASEVHAIAKTDAEKCSIVGDKRICQGQIFTDPNGRQSQVFFLFENDVIQYGKRDAVLSFVLGFDKYIGFDYITVGDL